MENTELEIIETEVQENETGTEATTELETQSTETGIEVINDVTETETGESTGANIEAPIINYNVESIDYTETLTMIQQDASYLPIIANDVRVILVFVLLSFCWSCMRAWRINSLRGGK